MSGAKRFEYSWYQSIEVLPSELHCRANTIHREDQGNSLAIFDTGCDLTVTRIFPVYRVKVFVNC